MCENRFSYSRLEKNRVIKHKLPLTFKPLSTVCLHTVAPMQCFVRFSTWQKIVVIQAGFCGISLFIVFSAFAHLFYIKKLYRYFESLRVANSDFGIEVLTFRAC